MEEGWVLDGTIAQDSTQVAGIWALREGISVALKHAGAAHHTVNDLHEGFAMPFAQMTARQVCKIVKL